MFREVRRVSTKSTLHLTTSNLFVTTRPRGTGPGAESASSQPCHLEHLSQVVLCTSDSSANSGLSRMETKGGKKAFPEQVTIPSNVPPHLHGTTSLPAAPNRKPFHTTSHIMPRIHQAFHCKSMVSNPQRTTQPSTAPPPCSSRDQKPNQPELRPGTASGLVGDRDQYKHQGHCRMRRRSCVSGQGV